MISVELLLVILLNLLLLLLSAPEPTIESEAFIKVVRFQVPALVRQGDSAKIGCIYELSGETLHAMKLFKDDKEFYRFTESSPKEERKMSFGVAGISVDLSRSNEREVLLKNVNKKTAGLFKCQVSVENTFKSVSAEKRMNVTSSSSATTIQQTNSAGTRTAMLDPSGLVVGGAAAFANSASLGQQLSQQRQQQQRQAAAAVQHQHQHHLSSLANNNNNLAQSSSSSSHHMISSAQEASAAAAARSTHQLHATSFFLLLCALTQLARILHSIGASGT